MLARFFIMLIWAWAATVPTLRPMVILLEAALLWVFATLAVQATLPWPRTLAWGQVPVIAAPRQHLLAKVLIKRIYAGCALAPALCPLPVLFVAAMALTHTTSGV